jgi:hypothetical protein
MNERMNPPSGAVGHERVELYLYSPYGPYGLYRTSVPVQGRTLPLFLHSTIRAMGWMVQGSSPGGGEIFRICRDRPWGPPSLLYNEYRVFPGGIERPGSDADPSPPSSAMIKKE